MFVCFLENSASSVWFGLATILSEVATCQHHKNEVKAREMEMTADQFETLQMYNNMRKTKAPPDGDSDKQVEQRILFMCNHGAMGALASLAGAKSERIRDAAGLVSVHVSCGKKFFDQL